MSVLGLPARYPPCQSGPSGEIPSMSVLGRLARYPPCQSWAILQDIFHVSLGRSYNRSFLSVMGHPARHAALSKSSAVPGRKALWPVLGLRPSCRRLQPLKVLGHPTRDPGLEQCQARRSSKKAGWSMSVCVRARACVWYMSEKKRACVVSIMVFACFP